MNDILTFEKLITPMIIQVLFWIVLVLIVLSALGAMFTQSFLMGLGMLVLGPIFWRVYCEIMIVLFRMNDNLRAIRHGGSMSGGTSA